MGVNGRKYAYKGAYGSIRESMGVKNWMYILLIFDLFRKYVHCILKNGNEYIFA